MSTFTTPFRYPVHWGSQVVNRFVERYARGTYNVSRVFDVSPGVVRWWMTKALCQGLDLKFRSYKETIKAFDHYGWYDIEGMDKSARILLYRWIAFIAEDDALDDEIYAECDNCHLTGFENSPSI